ncbi:S41 family peptidase [Glaciecola sp. XM2]|uniref:S41 family peptidase n=1 Tax=Glaciecola sp. XM2 TaxID=1914931 RepID=UPI0020327BD6|nr:S41 family peptidase [Glaciecola sp. XM2]
MSHKFKKTFLPLMGLFFTSLLVGCGGGGGNSSPAPQRPSTSPPPPSQPTWTAGVYAPSNQFVARCEAPRSGTDPFTGEVFPDRAGSALTEKLWLRSWTNETYLWFDEVPDNNPNNFSIPDYFDQLKTDAVTASGELKDNFHFSQSTAEYNQRTQSGTSSGYGISWEFVANTAPRELIVRYTEPNSPAARAGLPRGASLKRIDGIDFVNTNDGDEIDAINAALFSGDPGAVHTFELVTASNEPLSVELTSTVVALSPVQNVNVFDTAAGRIGYMQFNSFISPAQPGLISAFQRFVDDTVTDVIIDLRYNGGGLLALSSQIAYMIAGPNQTNNRIFEQLVYNSKTANPPGTPFYDREIDYVNGVFTSNDLPSPELARVFILSSENTCSASESLINSLLGIDVEVVLIGDTTCGKPFGFVPEDNCGTTYFTIQFQGVNAKGFGEFSDGFSPVASPVFQDQVLGCTVADDFSNPLGSVDEALLSTAIYFAENNECPSIAPQPASLNKRDRNDPDGRAIRTPNPYLDAIINEDRSMMGKGVN